MPKIDWEGVEESTVKEYDRKEIIPGCYMCRVQAVRATWHDSRGNVHTADDKQCVKLILDVDEGECAGKFSEPYWEGEEKDWGHTLYLSWRTDGAKRMAKHTLSAFDDANAGFDAGAAFDADKWEFFVGKRVKIYWGGEEYEYNGETRMRVRPERAITSDENPKGRVKLLDGKTRELYEDWRERTTLEAQRNSSMSTAAPSYYDDVPFS